MGDNNDKTIKDNKKNSYFWRVNNRNTIEYVDTSINNENINLNDNKNTNCTNRVDQTVISDYINPDVDDAINNMNIESDNKNVLSNDVKTNDRLSKELNEVMDK